MNNDLISRSALIREIDYWLDRFSNDLVKYALFKKARDIITNAPTAAPEVYGRWVYFTKETDECCDTWRCSVCGARFVTEFGFEEQDFCPNCGARMDGGERMKPKMKTREICQYIPCGQTEFCEHECYIKRLEDENARMKAENDL